MKKNNDEVRNTRKEIVDWAQTLIVSLVVVIVFYTFFFRVVTVDGQSMDPTLQQNDRMLMRVIGYTPQRGDIVVIDSYSQYGKPLIKRVIGLPGDVIDIDFATGDVSVNGTVLDEPYIAAPTVQQHEVRFPVTVEEGHIFVMGDNRPISLDSRSSDVGQLDCMDVLGKVFFRIFPLQKIGTVR